ncbi:hypothetical protein BC830DRAFT_1068188 [Chytriomyces sp. MP71]|nr:hypothetical protein BC830DRAFT_1068188 [Chytriomyces sp. MP71]
MPDAVLDPSADFVVDLEGIDADKLASDVPVTTVQLDALALLAIAKHAANSIDAGADRSVAAANRYDRDHTNTPIGPHGSLLGLDVCGFLEVASALPALGNAMAVNPTLGAEINPDALESPAAAHHARLLNGIATLGFDSNVVGFYVCAPMGAFWSQALLDALYGLQKATPCAVLVVYDPVRTAHGNLSLRALRLTQQTMSLMATKKFTLDAIHAANVTPSTLFESVPLQLKNSALAHAMFATLDLQLLTDVTFPSSSTSRAPGATGAVGLHPHFDSLDLGAGEVYLERHLEALCDAVEDYGQEQWRWQGWNRSLQKEQQKAALGVAKKRGENAAREASGLPALHVEADIVALPASLTRVLANEPSRLETLVLAGQMDTWCKQIHSFAGPGLTKMYLTKAVSRV